MYDQFTHNEKENYSLVKSKQFIIYGRRPNKTDVGTCTHSETPYSVDFVSNSYIDSIYCNSSYFTLISRDYHKVRKLLQQYPKLFIKLNAKIFLYVFIPYSSHC